MPGKIIIPMITPHLKNNLDLEALQALIAYARKNGFDGLFPASSTGGCASLSFKKHLEVLGEVITMNPGLKLFANISRNNLDETLEMERASEDLGYENFVTINPYYHKFSDQSIEAYYSRVASKTSGNVYLYNNPSLTGITVKPDVVRKVASEYSAIRGIKDSGGDIEKHKEFLKIKGIEVYQGKDHMLEESLKLGSYGGVCSTSNFSLNTLHVAHDPGNVSAFTERIRKVSSVMTKYEVPTFHNYMFRRFVLEEDNPRDYMNSPFTDLADPPSPQEVWDIL